MKLRKCSSGVCGTVSGVKALSAWFLTNFPEISRLDVVCSTFFFQTTLYVMIILARRAFTLGELVLVAHGATALFLETVNISIIKVRRFIFT